MLVSKWIGNDILPIDEAVFMQDNKAKICPPTQMLTNTKYNKGLLEAIKYAKELPQFKK